MAWLLEPRAAEYRLGTPLNSRILIHNAGKDVIVFRTRAWHQGRHTARDTKGANIKVDATTWLTRPPLVAFRLWPGEFVEVNATGIGVGAKWDPEDWQNARVGSWLEAKAGDEVTVTTRPVPLGDGNEAPPNGEPQWWLDLIMARLARELPLPVDADERAHLVYRAGMDLFGTPLSAEEIAAFVEDRERTALEGLAERLSRRPGLIASSGACNRPRQNSASSPPILTARKSRAPPAIQAATRSEKVRSSPSPAGPTASAS